MTPRRARVSSSDILKASMHSENVSQAFKMSRPAERGKKILSRSEAQLRC